MEGGREKEAMNHGRRDRKDPQRPSWKKSVDFLFAAVGMSVGLGNIWRFPYLCFKNGGGAFLIPYFLLAFVLAIPVMVLETSIGQRFRRGISASWDMVPVFKGIAFAQIVVNFHSNVSYIIILVWSFKYLVASFSSTLPWATCSNSWNSAKCITPNQLSADSNTSAEVNQTARNATWNFANCTSNATQETVSSATEYWIHEVLKLSPGVESPGSLCPDLVLYLFIMWLGVYFCTFKGIKWSAKVVYLTATLPFLLIAIILVRGVTLEGAGEGLKYYLIPDLSRLADPTVWISAGTQVLFSYCTGCSVLATMGSYNDYHHNFLKDSILIAITNSVASFASGFAVFSTIGFMANYQNTTVENVASSGPGLVFIVYPEALSLLPLPQFWSVLFFVTLLFLGFDSQFVFQESFLSFFCDMFPRLLRKRELLQAVLCLLLMTIGLSMVTQGGVYVFEMYNNYAFAGWILFFSAGCECVAVAWCYGFERYWKDVTDMIGNRRGKLWIKISWKYVAPILCSVTTVYYLAKQTPLTYRSYVYPGWAQFIAYLLSFSSVLWIPGFAVYKLVKVWRKELTFSEILRSDKKPKVEDDGSLSSSEEKRFTDDKEMEKLSKADLFQH